MTAEELYRAKANRLIDLTGRTFGRYTIIRRDGVVNARATWWVRCSCGHEEARQGDSLRNGIRLDCKHGNVPHD